AAFVTPEQFHCIPEASLFTDVEKGWRWGGEGAYCWFTARYTVPADLAGQDLYIRPHIGGYEALVWVNGETFGTFASKIVFTAHGTHYCDLIKKAPAAGEVIDIAVEYYAGHAYKGCMPLEEEPLLDYDFAYNGIDICTKNLEVQEFYFDLVTLNQLVELLPADSFRRAEAVNALYEMHRVLYYSFEDTNPQTFFDAVRQAHVPMKKVLEAKNAEGAPFAAVIGHAHMDTAWLWHIDETIKKCARTFSNQVSLMEQYPEYKFIQSSACHGDMILTHYPNLFERIKKLVAEGRYEPNGAVWVECDCNITSGESMVRQFLWGQRFTRKHFNYTSDCFWLPDTFGYSAAIPQIMKSCGVDYFLTTKIGWNDTNPFPYDTFYWQGLDGTKVFTHFNTTHCPPDAKTLSKQLKEGYGETIRETTVTDKRICAYGYGDGGGGPQFEMIELAARCKDLNGVPKAEHMLVSDAMKFIESTAVNPNTFTGELYLELHRGTLTNQHNIKRNNRKAEFSLRDLEFFTVNQAVKNDLVAASTAVEPLYRLMLINQFHDILPGTCIPKAHIQSHEETTEIIETSAALIADIADSSVKESVTLTNTLSFERSSPVLIDYTADLIVEGDYKQQLYTDLDGNLKLMISGVKIPAFSSVALKLVKGAVSSNSAFSLSDNSLTTPFAKVEFDDRGYISSFIDTRLDREICGEGYPLNTFLVAEDVPLAWDGWDLDADIESKFKDTAELVSREIFSQGEVALVLRSKYRLTEKTTVTQDMFFFADTAEVRFDALMDWQDDHRFLKTAFDTSIMQDFARCEVQFGFVKRPTTRNNSLEKAKFEVLNHKYTDLSEARYGVAILNDCKYAISLEGGQMRLSLHKGGNRPDFRGDKGLHRCVYSFLPHDSGFDVNSVIKPAYELNIPPVVSGGEHLVAPLIEVEADNIIVEAIKPCEDNERAFIVRMYDAEGAYTPTSIKLFEGAKAAEITNMLEETLETIADVKAINLTFRPFEIKTLKIHY
ncbi:MAG TPA: glycoside hydrolase family 38 C-terminal domain-containing protein, partial [Clostridia bacterium]|nr:glycoside hydrolase family 38 C-terminal domain-containing protein [Clostridia bacterium]